MFTLAQGYEPRDSPTGLKIGGNKLTCKLTRGVLLDKNYEVSLG